MFSLPARAQQSAALIGIAKYSRPDDLIHPDQVQLGIQYSTILIVRDGPKATAKITLPDIIVPHGNQWWRVGVRFECKTKIITAGAEDSEGTKVEDWVEQLYTSPIEKAPQLPATFVESSDSCPAQLVADFKRGKDSREAGDAVASSNWPFQPCAYISIAITAVTTDFVSTLHHGANSGDCETRGYSRTDEGSVSIIENSAPMSYSDLLGENGGVEYKRVLLKSGKDLEARGFNCGLSEDQFNPENRWAIDGTGWFLLREKGKWQGAALLQSGNAACQYGGRLSLHLPKDVVGHDVLRPTWASLQRQIAGLQDAFTSPVRDMVVAVANSQIEIYALEGQHVGRRLLTLPADRVVMVQWATGKYIEKWADELHMWQQKGLPPVIRRPQD
jgi:hypothetical protein